MQVLLGDTRYPEMPCSRFDEPVRSFSPKPTPCLPREKVSVMPDAPTRHVSSGKALPRELIRKPCRMPKRSALDLDRG
jgi:hypothetical protein